MLPSRNAVSSERCWGALTSTSSSTKTRVACRSSCSTGPATNARNRQIIRPTEQGDRWFHLVVSFDVKAYPAAIRQNVVRFGHACGYQLISNALWKRDIGEMIPMNVANLFTA